MALAMKATVETTVAIAAATCQSIDGIMSRHYLREKSAATVFFVVNPNFHFKSYFRLAPTTVRLQTQSSSPVLSQRRFPPQQWASSCPARSRNARKCRFSNRFRRQFSFPPSSRVTEIRSALRVAYPAGSNPQRSFFPDITWPIAKPSRQNPFRRRDLTFGVMRHYQEGPLLTSP